MKSIIKIVPLMLSFFMFFSCYKDSEEEIAINKSVVIPVDKPIEIEILEKINKYRINNGIRTLTKLDIIKSQTQSHTSYMIEKSKISHHYFPTRSSYFSDQTGAVKVGENVARGYSSPEYLVQAWINSPTHRNTILDNYTHFNITALQNQNGVWYYGNIFIRK